MNIQSDLDLIDELDDMQEQALELESFVPSLMSGLVVEVIRTKNRECPGMHHTRSTHLLFSNFKSLHILEFRDRAGLQPKGADPEIGLDYLWTHEKRDQILKATHRRGVLIERRQIDILALDIPNYSSQVRGDIARFRWSDAFALFAVPMIQSGLLHQSVIEALSLDPIHVERIHRWMSPHVDARLTPPKITSQRPDEDSDVIIDVLMAGRYADDDKYATW